MRSIWGFGGARFEKPESAEVAIQFDNALGQMWVIEDKSTWVTRSRKTVQIVHGYRVHMRIRLFNIGIAPNDANSITELFEMISNTITTGIKVYPRYSLTNVSLLGFLCRLTSPIAPQDIANVPVGQWIDLDFESIELLDRIPSTNDIPEYYNLVTTDGDNMVTTDGNNLVVRVN